jgi:hypothetical protein
MKIKYLSGCWSSCRTVEFLPSRDSNKVYYHPE